MTFSPSTQWTYRFHVHWVCYTSAFRTCVPLPAVVGCVRLGILYLDFEIPFLKFCSKTRNQKMDFNRSWWAPDFNSEKAVLKVESNQEIQIRISFPFHFSFLSMLLGNPKKRFAGTGETAVLSWEQFSNPFPLLPRRKNGEKWKSYDGFLGLKICF